MAGPPEHRIWFLREEDLSESFSIRFEVEESIGAVQVRPSRDTTPTGTTGTIRRVVRTEVTNCFLLYRETNSTAWGELPLWPDELDPMTLPAGEWVERAADGSSILAMAFSEEPELTLEEEEEDTVAESTEAEPPPDGGLDEPTFPGVVLDEDRLPISGRPIQSGDYPSALIRMLRQENTRLTSELRLVREEMIFLKRRLKRLRNRKA